MTDRAEIAHPFVASIYDLVVPERTLFASHRATLAADLSGRVLEIGTGTGAMFAHVARERSDALEYHAIEPDPYMRDRAREKARDVGLAVDLRDARAESLPYPDDAFDVVLSAMVFCTIADPDSAVEEVARVLKPGGEFRFLEHVHADGALGASQELFNPAWRRLAGGCNLDRRTVERFVGTGEFDVLELEQVDFPVPSPIPFVRGRLRRRRDASFVGC